MTEENPETKNEFYALIQHEQPKGEFEENITTIQQDFGDLIDEDAAAFLIVDKLGYNKANVMQLADVHPGQEATVQGIITGIQPIRTFTRKNGRQGKVANILISDKTGSLPVVLWNEDTSRVESGEFKLNMHIKIINGYTKQGRNGVELHVGRWSTISNESTHDLDSNLVVKENNAMNGHQHLEKIKGTILSISPTNVFFKKDETYGFVSKVHLKTTKGIQLITVWDNQVKSLQGYNQGDTVEFSYLDVKMNNGKKEYHANGKAMIRLC
jgi:replication factor A1